MWSLSRMASPQHRRRGIGGVERVRGVACVLGALCAVAAGLPTLRGGDHAAAVGATAGCLLEPSSSLGVQPPHPPGEGSPQARGQLYDGRISTR